MQRVVAVDLGLDAPVHLVGGGELLPGLADGQHGLRAEPAEDHHDDGGGGADPHHEPAVEAQLPLLRRAQVDIPPAGGRGAERQPGGHRQVGPLTDTEGRLRRLEALDDARLHLDPGEEYQPPGDVAGPDPAAGEDDPPEGPLGLRHPVGQRALDLAEDAGEAQFQHPGRPADEVLGAVAELATDRPLRRLGGLGRDAELVGDGRRQQVAAGGHGPHEPRDPSLVHDHGGEPGPDGDDGLCHRSGRPGDVVQRGLGLGGGTVGQGPDEGEGNQVDGHRPEPAGGHRRQQGVERRAVGGDQEDLDLRRAPRLGRRGGLEDGVVEDRLLERDRDVVRGGESDGAGELLVGHRRHVDDPHDDAGPRQADPDVPGPQPRLAPQLGDGGADGGGVDDLAVADRAGRQGYLADPGDGGRGGENDLDDADRAGPDVEAEHALGHRSPLSAVGAVAEVALDVRPADAEVLPDAYGREVSCLDQAVDRHV